MSKIGPRWYNCSTMVSAKRFLQKSLAGIVAAGMYLAVLDRSTAIAFSIGFVSHLIADAMTPMGIKPLWPLGLPHIKGPVKTGSLMEWVIAIVLLIAIGCVTGIVQMRIVI